MVGALLAEVGVGRRLNFFTIELAAKRLELLRELVPGAARMAVLVTAANAETTVRDVEAAKRAPGLQIQSSTSIREIDATFATFGRELSDCRNRSHRADWGGWWRQDAGRCGPAAIARRYQMR